MRCSSGAACEVSVSAVLDSGCYNGWAMLSRQCPLYNRSGAARRGADPSRMGGRIVHEQPFGRGGRVQGEIGGEERRRREAAGSQLVAGRKCASELDGVVATQT